MKIYVLPVSEKFQPKNQTRAWPAHNDDFGVEQDFSQYLLQSNLLTQNSTEADWHYLPIYWTRWHINHAYGKEGLPELQAEVSRVLLDDKKTFTICQYDDGPMADLGAGKVFLSSRMAQAGMDIPLLSNAHPAPGTVNKKYLASFVGNFSSHPVRQKMADALKGAGGIFMFDSHKKRNRVSGKLLQLFIMIFFSDRANFFVRKTREAYVALCPRGYGGSSFRFFEAMQLGVVPFLIGDMDTRPFKDVIKWDNISFYTNDTGRVMDMINAVDKKTLLAMGQEAKKVYEEKLAYQKWCPLVIEKLKNHGIT